MSNQKTLFVQCVNFSNTYFDRCDKAKKIKMSKNIISTSFWKILLFSPGV